MARNSTAKPVSKPDAPRRWFRRIRWPWVLLLIGLIGGAGYYWMFASASGLYWQAKRLAQSDPQKAERLVRESIGLADGDYPQAQLLWSQLLADSGQWTEAFACFSQIQNSASCDQSELLHLGQQAMAAQQTLLADYTLSAANRPGPEQPDVLEWLIQLKLQTGQNAEALKFAQSLRELSPERIFPWRVLARLAVERRELSEALSAGQQALQRNPNPEEEANIRTILLDAYLLEGNVLGARKELDWLFAHRETTDSLRIKAVQVLRMEGQREKALEQVAQVLKHAPQSKAALMMRGVLWFDGKNYQAALEDFTRVVERDSFNKEAHYKLAQSATRLNKPELAKKHSEISQRLTNATLAILAKESQLASDPQNRTHLFELAALYRTVGQFARAEEIQNHLETLDQ